MLTEVYGKRRALSQGKPCPFPWPFVCEPALGKHPQCGVMHRSGAGKWPRTKTIGVHQCVSGCRHEWQDQNRVPAPQLVLPLLTAHTIGVAAVSMQPCAPVATGGVPPGAAYVENWKAPL